MEQVAPTEEFLNRISNRKNVEKKLPVGVTWHAKTRRWFSSPIQPDLFSVIRLHIMSTLRLVDMEKKEQSNLLLTPEI